MAAPTDFTRNPAATDPSLNPNSVGGATPEQRLLGGRIEELPTLARLASPATFIGSDTPPILIIHGSDDEIVPVSQAEYLYQALEAKGIKVTFIRVAGGNHDAGPPDRRTQDSPFHP